MKFYSEKCVSVKKNAFDDKTSTHKKAKIGANHAAR